MGSQAATTQSGTRMAAKETSFFARILMRDLSHSAALAGRATKAGMARKDNMNCHFLS
jgi:hypothetical protein